MKTNIITIDADEIVVRLSEEHEFLLDSKEVARGYGVSPEVIRTHKRDHSDELLEGKHWTTVTNSNSPTGVGNPNARQSGLKRGNDTVTLWTKLGVITLGFFIRSERAKRFRAAAAALVLREVSAPSAETGALTAALTAVAQGLAQNIAAVTRLIESQTALARRVEANEQLVSARLEQLERRVFGGTSVAPGAIAASDDPGVVYLRRPRPRAARRGWVGAAPFMPAVQADMATLLRHACAEGQAVLTADELLTLAERLGLFRGQLSPFAPKVALGILLTRLEGRSFEGVTITKHRLSRQRRYILTRSASASH